jgi:hypothetical protein
MRKLCIVVAREVQTEHSTVRQPMGRLAAQSAHVARAAHDKFDLAGENITTIVLEARNSDELYHIMEVLTANDQDYVLYADSNPVEYQTNKDVVTALAVEPFDDVLHPNALWYLPLLGCACG